MVVSPLLFGLGLLGRRDSCLFLLDVPRGPFFLFLIAFLLGDLAGARANGARLRNKHREQEGQRRCFRLRAVRLISLRVLAFPELLRPDPPGFRV